MAITVGSAEMPKASGDLWNSVAPVTWHYIPVQLLQCVAWHLVSQLRLIFVSCFCCDILYCKDQKVLCISFLV
ncbi:hypothetical protein M404DRAFT_182890 [Pisolithus tinctorius Marx 270]|uniref:Uncharacterized protein n=1 Tax=Pisolithus tinctorius Marx 270 TaxID=870435 RepID=A0A0C3PZA5_PISTI|nr:hypothetical protein M404DRAFT_182890 [Pisolithus tinctorius Marx 270]